MTEKFVTIKFVWVQSVIDPVQYKPLSPTIQPIGVQVEVQVPNESVYVASEKDGIITLTPDGMAYASRVISNAISKSYQEKK